MTDFEIATADQEPVSLLETKTALPVKEGYLIKRGETVKSWKRRWFQLRGGQLYYYKEKGDVLLGTISLNDSDVGHMDYVNKQNCFAIKTTKRIFYCIADTTSDATEWIDSIVKHGVNARLVPEGIRVTQSTRAVKMGKRGIEVTTSPMGRIKTTLRSSTLKDPSASSNTPHTFHRKFVNGLVKCSTCKGQLKKQCYLCQVCRCCIHPRCFKDTPSNCYSRDDFNLEERPTSPRLEFVTSELPRLHDVRADRAKNPGRRLPERISQRVRESGVYRRDDYPVYGHPPDIEEDYQLTNTEPEIEAPAVAEPPKIFGAVKVGVALNPADLNRRLATTGNRLNHRGSIVSADVDGASTRQGLEEVAPRGGPPTVPRAKKPPAPGLRSAKSVPAGQLNAVTSGSGEFSQSTPVSIPTHASVDLSDQVSSPRKLGQLDFLDQFDFINTPLSVEEEENPEAVVPTSLRRDSLSTSPRTERTPPAKRPPMGITAKKTAKKAPTVVRARSVPEQDVEMELPQPIEVEPEENQFDMDDLIPIDDGFGTNPVKQEVSVSPPKQPSIDVIPPAKPKGRVSNTKIPEFPVEYMTRELPPIDPTKRSSSTEKREKTFLAAAALPKSTLPESLIEEPVEPIPYQPDQELMPIESSEEESSSSSESAEVYVEPTPQYTPIEVVAPLDSSPIASPQNVRRIPGPKKGAMRPKGTGNSAQQPTVQASNAVPSPTVIPPTSAKQPQQALKQSGEFKPPQAVAKQPQQAVPEAAVVSVKQSGEIRPPQAVAKQPQQVPEATVEVKPIAAGSPKPKQPASVPKGKGPGPKVPAAMPDGSNDVKPATAGSPKLVKQQSVPAKEPVVEALKPLDASPPQSPILTAAAFPPKQSMTTSAIKKPAPPGAKRGLTSSGQNAVPGVKKSGEFNNVVKQVVTEPERTVAPPPEPATNKLAIAAKPQATRPPETNTPPAVKKGLGPKVPAPKKAPAARPKESAPKQPVDRPNESPRGVGRSGEFDSWSNNQMGTNRIEQQPEPIDIPVIEAPVAVDDIVVNSDNKPAVRAVRKASMTRRAVDFPQTKHEKPVEVIKEPVFDDWSADVEEIQEAKDLIEDEFEDAFTDFDNFDDVMSALHSNTSDLDVLIKDSKYGAWDLDDSSTSRSSANVVKNAASKSNNNAQPVEEEYYEEEQPASTVTEEYGDYEAW